MAGYQYRYNVMYASRIHCLPIRPESTFHNRIMMIIYYYNDISARALDSWTMISHEFINVKTVIT